MGVDKWQCKYDDHINTISELSCEICGKPRPLIKELKYLCLEEYGTIKIKWSIENFEKGKLKLESKIFEISDDKAELEIKKIKHKQKLVLIAENEICEISEELIILLDKPEILDFFSSEIKILENGTIDLTWNTINATKVTINSIGKVSQKGILTSVKPKSSFKIVAENEVGKSEKNLKVEILPLPKISSFKPQQQKIEFGKNTTIHWQVTNAEKVELCFDGKTKMVSMIDRMEVNPLKETVYQLVVTALDGKTTIKKEISIQVFHQIEIQYFKTSSILIPRGLEMEFSWNILHAQQIVLKSNDGLNEIVQPNQVFKFFPAKSSSYWLEAKNDLFQVKSNSLRIEVDNAPQMTRIPSFFEENQIPLINFKLPELQSVILDQTVLEFERMIQPKRSFSLTKMINSILKK
jgi:hypothetical protein